MTPYLFGIIKLKKPAWLKYLLLNTKEILPSEYEGIEYLESTGYQYIDLDVIGRSITNFDLKLATTDENPSVIRRILGGYTSSNRFELAIHNERGMFFNYYNSSIYSDFVPTLNEPIIVKKKANKISYNDTESSLSTATFSSEKSSYLFASNRSATSKFIGRIYYCKVWQNGDLVRNMVPCIRKSDNVAGMYDFVSKELFVNKGSSDFITP